MTSLFGLPAHPLFVHAPLVLMPLLALAAVPLSARPRWRQQLGPALAVGALVLALATLLAMQSGEGFETALDGQVDISDHKSLANITRLLVILFLLGSLTVVALDRMRSTNRPAWADKAASLAMGITTLVAVLGTVWMIRTGHEGARLVWDGVL